MNPQTMTALKDWAQIVTTLVGIAAFLFTAFKAIVEVKANRGQRSEELQWKQAQAAKGLLDDIHHDEFARQAVHMMDWPDGEPQRYKLSDGSTADIGYSDVLAALRLNKGEACDDRSRYIRDCFDWFFYRVDQIEHYIRRKLIQFDDVNVVFVSYARQVANHPEVFGGFLEFHEYDLARAFFARYPHPT